MSLVEMFNISFIGMPGCGKSTLGNAISKELNLSFVDTDLLIEKKFEMTLEDVKNKFGYQFVRSSEEEVILSLNNSTQIISTGGSAIYSDLSMEHLKSFSRIIYINTSLETIIERIDLGQERGLAVPDGVSISDVYSERKPLYERFAQNTIDGSLPVDVLLKLTQEMLNE